MVASPSRPRLQLATVGNLLSSANLSLKSERRAHLVSRLTEILGVEGSAKPESDARAELDVVSESCDTAIINLCLISNF